MLFGLTHAHDAAAIGYAVVEGVSFGLADGWASLKGASRQVQALSLVGGGARSQLWAQLLASVLGVTLRVDAGARPVRRSVRRGWHGWPTAAMRTMSAAPPRQRANSGRESTRRSCSHDASSAFGRCMSRCATSSTRPPMRETPQRHYAGCVACGATASNALP